ncbi:hypothetical protein DM02DRAFT_648041, partial [Periconia macrospinosa]
MPPTMKTVLTSSAQYNEWLTTLKSQAIASKVWDIFDPTSEAEALEEPEYPVPPTLRQFTTGRGSGPAGAHLLNEDQLRTWNAQVDYYKLQTDYYKNIQTKYQAQQ